MYYWKDENQLTVILKNGTSMSWRKGNHNFEKAYNMCLRNDFLEVEFLGNMEKVICEKGHVIDGKIYVNTDNGKREIDDKNTLTGMIKLMHRNGYFQDEINELMPFLKKVFNNKYIDCLSELYDFCSNGDFAITEDGDIIAYKHVMYNMCSVYDKTTRHVIGKRMEVENFNTDRYQTCSEGLHFCSYEYLGSYPGEITLLVKVNPEDIVSIPADSNFTKGRARAYTPVAIINEGTKISDYNLYEITGFRSINEEMEDEECDSD